MKNIFCHRKFQNCGNSIFRIGICYFLRKLEFLSLIQLVAKWLFSCGNYSSGITMGYLCQGPPIEEGVVTAIKLKRRRGGVLPIYHRASILDYENFWISRSDTILLNNKSPRNIHFLQNIHFFVMAYRSYFQNLSRGLLRRSLTSRARS